MATPGFTLSNSSPTILMIGGSFGSIDFWFASQIEIGSVLKIVVRVGAEAFLELFSYTP